MGIEIISSHKFNKMKARTLKEIGKIIDYELKPAPDSYQITGSPVSKQQKGISVLAGVEVDLYYNYDQIKKKILSLVSKAIQEKIKTINSFLRGNITEISDEDSSQNREIILLKTKARTLEGILNIKILNRLTEEGMNPEIITFHDGNVIVSKKVSECTPGKELIFV